MRKDGWPAMCIHGDKQQKERDWVLGEFKLVVINICVNFFFLRLHYVAYGRVVDADWL
jgi:hypothetical protein